MLGLFGAIDLGQRALQVQQQGMEVTGHNLANVNQPGYSRQRLDVQSARSLGTSIGQQGTGIDATGIQQLRSTLLDQQMISDLSVSSATKAEQQAMQMAQAGLGQLVDQSASDTQGTTASSGVAGQTGLTETISDLFSGFQDLATQPSQSEARQGLLVTAENLAQRFQQIDLRLKQVNGSLNESVKADVTSANDLLEDIATLNQSIARAEQGNQGSANDLRDSRQQKLEALAKLVKIDTADAGQGRVEVSVAGATLINDTGLVDRLEAYDPGTGQLGIRTQAGGAPLTLTGGSLHGTIEARDVDLAKLQSGLDQLAATMITEINTIHTAGFSLTGTTGEVFFSGTGAADIAVNQNLSDNPALIQASGSAFERSGNQIALALGKLSTTTFAALGDRTFSQSFAQTVTTVGQTLDSLNTESETQSNVEQMLTAQRDAISGVSMDEEVTNLLKYQKAFQASAKLISTVAEMLDTVLSLKT